MRTPTQADGKITIGAFKSYGKDPTAYAAASVTIGEWLDVGEIERIKENIGNVELGDKYAVTRYRVNLWCTPADWPEKVSYSQVFITQAYDSAGKALSAAKAAVKKHLRAKAGGLAW